MKKVYFFLVICFVLSITASAQSTCTHPGGIGLPFEYTGSCFVYVTLTLPEADISVYDNKNVRINVTEAKTGTDGSGTVFYECGYLITRVALTLPDGTTCEISGPNLAAPATLPVKLANFNAQVKGESGVALLWSSVFELDSYQYLVQRSTDGRNFTTIGKVAAAGNSSHPLSYDFEDTQLGSGIAYYRLMMVDIDSKSEFSKTVYVNNRKGTSNDVLSVFPNPFRSEIQLRGITTAEVNAKNVRLYSAMGKEVKYTITGSNAITIDAGATPGVYILRVKNQVYKLIKE